MQGIRGPADDNNVGKYKYNEFILLFKTLYFHLKDNLMFIAKKQSYIVGLYRRKRDEKTTRERTNGTVGWYKVFIFVKYYSST